MTVARIEPPSRVRVAALPPDDEPPHDIEAERALLGCTLVDPAAIGAVRSSLRPEHLYSEAHRRIYEAQLRLDDKGSRTDSVIVASALRDAGRLTQVGGMPYLAQLLLAAPAIANACAYAEIIVEKWRLRQIKLVARRLDRSAGLGGSAEDLLAGVRAELNLLASPASAATSTALLDGPTIAAQLPELEYLVPEIGLVAGGGAPHLVAGYGFSGKTLVLQALMLSLAAGRTLWGVYPAKCRRVVHVDLEQGERLTRRRYQRLARTSDIDLGSLGDALVLAGMPPGLSLTSQCAEVWRGLMTGRDLLVLDSLRAATAGADENDSSIRGGLDMLGALSEATGCRALVVHHARKQGKDDPGGRYAIRGSSAIFDGVDGAYLFSAEKGEPVAVEHVKARTHGEPVESFALVISDVPIDGDPKGGLRVQVHGGELVAQRRDERERAAKTARTDDDARRVRQAISAHPGSGSVELRSLTHLSGDRLAAALTTLSRDVEIRKEKCGRTWTKRHYLRGSET